MEILLVFLAALFGLIGAAIAAGKNHSPALGFVLGAFFSILGLVVLALLPAAEPATEVARGRSGVKKCPDCAEPIRAEAKICRFCRHEFSEESIQEVARELAEAAPPPVEYKRDTSHRKMTLKFLLIAPALGFGFLLALIAISSIT